MKKYVLLSGVAACALGLAVANQPAEAFDEVNWVWNTEVNKIVTEEFNIYAELDPSGLVTLEDLQIFIGDVTATASVHDIFNYQGEEDDRDDDHGGGHDGGHDGDHDLASFNWDGGWGGHDGDHDHDHDHDDDDLVRLDALTELPEVINVATAVGNNADIYTEVATNIHEGQFVFGGGGGFCGGSPSSSFESGGHDGHDGHDGDDGCEYGDGENSNLELANLLTLAAGFGLLEKAEISASADVYNIVNATVDNAATAVANNKSIEVNAVTPSDAVLIGDITQFAYADVSANAQTSEVYLNNYANLGDIDRPIVNNIATAVGNSLDIVVTSPLGDEE
jgi:hypothetical protein